MAARIGIAWDKQPLGKLTDREIAARVGCSQRAVHQARTARGSGAAPRSKRGRTGIDWEVELLTTETNRELAERLGVNPKTVKSARGRLKMPSPREVKGTPQVRREVVDLRRKKWTLDEIAKLYEVSTTSIRNWLRIEGAR